MTEPAVFDPMEQRLTYAETKELGRREGQREGLRGVLAQQLQTRLGGTPPERLSMLLEACSDSEILARIADLVLEPLEPAELVRRVEELLRPAP